MNKYLGFNSKTYYAVETVFPHSDKPDGEFSGYTAFAFTDARDPGHSHAKMLVNTQPELFGRHLRTSNESMNYYNKEDAINAANFLEVFGRVTAGWEGSEDWRKKYRGAVKARVIEVTVTTDRVFVDRESSIDKRREQIRKTLTEIGISVTDKMIDDFIHNAGSVEE